jgi:AcrR family transcriptional regulator
MSRVADPRAKVSLLRAAEEVFAERGLAGAKVEEIARRAGVSKGAFYLHFDSKEAALEEVVTSWLSRCQGFFAKPTEGGGPLPEAPPEILDFAFARDLRIFEFFWETRAVLRILPSCHGDYEYLFTAFRAEIAQTSKEWVEHWKREEMFRRDVDAELAATLIGGAYNELVAKMLACGDTRPPLEEWLSFALDSFMRAFGTESLVAAASQRRAVSTDDRASPDETGRRRIVSGLHNRAAHMTAPPASGAVPRDSTPDTSTTTTTRGRT